MKRRSFLKTVGGAAGGVVLGAHVAVRGAEGGTTPAAVAGLPRRVLGRTGFQVSVIGFSGFALQHGNQEDCTKAVHQAFERGVNYFDVAPAYADGTCETRMGIALSGLDRKSLHIACKTKRRDKDGAREELERSLGRLKTDHFDVYQLHHLVKPDEVKMALGPGGAMEAILEAKKKGQVRAIGFSAHTTKAAVEALKSFPFDTVMFPINYVEYYTRDYGKEVLAVAREKGAAVLAIKPMSGGAWAEGAERKRKWWYRSLEAQEEINLAFRFTLSQPGVVVGFPPAWLDLQERAIEAGRALRDLDEADAKKLQEMARGCGSIFKREEDMVARGRQPHSPYPHSPHDPVSGEWA